MIALGVLGMVASWWGYHRHPTRKFSIIGASILWVSIINLVFANGLYDAIPATLDGVSTGKEQISRWWLNGFLGLAALPGFIAPWMDGVSETSSREGK